MRNQLDARLQSMYTEVDDVFRLVRTRPLTSGFRELQMRSHAREGRTVKVVDARVVPAAMATTANLLWQHMVDTNQGQAAKLQTDIDTPVHDTIRDVIHTTVLSPHGKGVFHGNVAMRRHVERERVVLLWHALLRPIEINGVQMDDLVVHHTEWTVVEAALGAPPELPATRVQCCHIMTTGTPPRGPTMMYDKKMDLLTSFVRNAISSHLDASQTMMEQALCHPPQAPVPA